MLLRFDEAEAVFTLQLLLLEADDRERDLAEPERFATCLALAPGRRAKTLEELFLDEDLDEDADFLGISANCLELAPGRRAKTLEELCLGVLPLVFVLRTDICFTVTLAEV